MSKKIISQLQGELDRENVKLRWFSELFCALPGLQNLWDVASCVKDCKESSLSASYKTGVLHTKHLTKYKASKAQELELSLGNRVSSKNRQQEMIVEKALALYLRLGNLRKHCELLKNSGRWEKALSLAPGVCLQYWRGLMKEYARALEKVRSEDALPHHMALGNVEKAISHLINTGEYEDALMVAQSATEGNTPSQAADEEPYHNGKATDSPSGEIADFVDECCHSLAERVLCEGDPCKASVHLLANNDMDAIGMLLRGNELTLALCLSKGLRYRGPHCQRAAVYISRMLEGRKRYYFAIEILKLFVTSADDDNHFWSPVHESCARFNGKEENRKNLHEFAGIPSPDQNLATAEDLERQGKLIQALQAYLVSSNQVRGLELGLKLIFEEMSKNSFTLESESFQKLDAVFCTSSAILTRPEQSRNKNILLATSSYIGALRAIKLGYITVVSPLLEHAIAMCERSEMMKNPDPNLPPFLLKSAALKSELNAWKTHLSGNRTNNRTTASAIDELFSRAGIDVVESNLSEISVTGSSLPSHSDVHVSTLTNTRINGPVFFLEDKTSVVALNEALMWAVVNPFSPTGSGERIYPF